MNIIQSITDKNLFHPFLEDGNGKLNTWYHWFVALQVLYGLKVSPKYAELIKTCTGRDIDKLPKEGFNTALFLTGRRSGKSRIASVIAAYEACLTGKEKLLAKGETPLVPVISPSRRQSFIVKNYLRSIFQQTTLLQNEIVQEEKSSFLLSDGVLIEILTGDWRSVRGYTLLACVVDELAFFGLDSESKVRSDTELIRALKPSLATTKGKMVCISSPYAERGQCYRWYKQNFGRDEGKVLVWNSPSRVMNPTLPQEIVDEAMTEDLQAAKSEYGGQFRQDIIIWLPREVIEAVVKKGRRELLPRFGIQYRAFVDVSGGRSDSSALCISHLEDKKVVIDFLKEHKAPHSPYKVIEMMGETLRKFGVRRVVGDNYSAEFAASAFKSQGFHYEKSKLNKSGLYLELIPAICSNAIELLDDETSIRQLAALERRTRSGGHDVIDHPAGGHDDLSNVIAGASFICGKKRKQAGSLFRHNSDSDADKELKHIRRARLVLAGMPRANF